MAKKIVSKELGFGTNTWENSQRFMNKDGSANVKRIGISGISASDLFHKLTTMKWGRFMLIVFSGYFIANILFAFLYYWTGIENLGLNPTGNFLHDYFEAFFFSTQCFTTVGFGRVNPTSTLTNIIASIESFSGLMAAALGTGLLYGRFSRPRAEIIKSDSILYSPYQNGVNAIMFRIASVRKFSTLVENQISVSIGFNQQEGDTLRRKFFNLALELDKINFLTTSWTIVHPITEDSPIYGMSHEQLLKSRAEFIVLFKGYEETNSQAVYEKFSYFIDELVWGAKFSKIIAPDDEGISTLHIGRISDFEEATLF